MVLHHQGKKIKMLKSGDVTLSTKVHLVKAMVFPVVMYACENWTIKKAVSSVQSLSRVQLLWPHELQHASPPCPSPTPGVYLNSCPLSWWCHPAISSSVNPFSSCPQSFPASGSFQMGQPFTSGCQILEFQLQHQSFQWTPRTDLL